MTDERESLQTRTITFRADERLNDGRIPVVVSSDAVVTVSDGPEVLVHEPDAVDLTRAPLPIIATHRSGQMNVGVVEDLRLAGGELRGFARFGERQEAVEIRKDVENKILRSVSAGYARIKGRIRDDGVLITTRWMPTHAAIVAEPADVRAGFYRSADGAIPQFEVIDERSAAAPEAHECRERPTHPAETAKPEKEVIMTEKNAEAGVTAEQHREPEHQTRSTPSVEVIREPGPSAVDLERGRRRAIENLCKANRIDNSIRDMWIGQGATMEQVSDDLLNILEERGRTNPQPASKIGLSGNDVQNFSMARAILACRDQNWTNAGFELECSRAVAQKLNLVPNPNKFYVPFEVMERPVAGRRALNAGAAGEGGNLVATDNIGFIEMLRNRSVAFRMGARRLSGLQGNVTIPRQSAAATNYWLATEATEITPSQQTFQQVSLTPHTAGAYTEISRQLLLQSSPSAEGIVTDDLAQVVARAADFAALAGAGTGGSPTGLLETSGIGSVTGTSLAYAGILEFQTDVATANVEPQAGGYVTTPAVAALLMQRARFSNTDTPLWAGNIWDGQVSGFRAMSSNQIPAATMIFGDWQELVIGEWGVLEVEVNPYANFQAGVVGVRAMYSMDVGVRRPFAFSAASTIT
jgi:HK97 family phage major capsid protein